MYRYFDEAHQTCCVELGFRESPVNELGQGDGDGDEGVAEMQRWRFFSSRIVLYSD